MVLLFSRTEANAPSWPGQYDPAPLHCVTFAAYKNEPAVGNENPGATSVQFSMDVHGPPLPCVIPGGHVRATALALELYTSADVL